MRSITSLIGGSLRLPGQRSIFLLAVLALLCPQLQGADAVRGLDKLDFREVIKESKDRVFPTVIFIKCVRESLEGGKKTSQEVSGSGVIISAEGEALSNWHVVDKAVSVRCMLSDGRGVDAEVVGTDKDTDIALLRLKLPKDAPALPYAPIGRASKLKEGDFIMAMGAPWGMSRSVSIGIISCARRFLPQLSEYNLWLQTDASISPGNSGGPMVNTDGEVVGLNTRATIMGGDTGFAVPSEVIQDVVEQLRAKGKVDWNWTGLELQPLNDFNRNIYFDYKEGVMVAATAPESPARRVGIEVSDRIIKVNGKSVTAVTEEDLPDIRRYLGLLTRDKPAKLEIVRQGKPMTIELTPRAKGKVEGEELDCPRWDLTVKAINQFDNPDLYFQKTEGIFVYGIKFPGNAQSSGLAAKDIITQIDGKDVITLDDVRKLHKQLIAEVATKHRIVLTVLRNGLMRQIVLDFSRNYEKE